MRIVHLIDYFQPKVGYQEYFLAKEHQKIGYEVYVVTSDRYYPFPSYDNTYKNVLSNRIVGTGERIEEGIKTIRLPIFEIPGTSLPILFSLKSTLRKLSPDIVFCHGVYSITSFRASLLKQKLRFKLIYDNHAAYFNTNLESSIITKLYHLLHQTIIVPRIKKGADSIFAIGEEERSFICNDFHLDKSAVPIIRLGVDTIRFRYSMKQRLRLRREFNLKASDLLIVFAGKIELRKDVHILIGALKMLDNNKLHLILIGGGEANYINELKEISGKLNVVWIPFVENAKLSHYYSAADIGIWPGDSTITLLEAMACRLPLILPDYYGTKYLDQSSAIVRFTRGNVQDLAKSLKTLIDNKKLRINMGLRAENFSHKRLSWRKLALQSLKLLDRTNYAN